MREKYQEYLNFMASKWERLPHLNFCNKLYEMLFDENYKLFHEQWWDFKVVKVVEINEVKIVTISDTN